MPNLCIATTFDYFNNRRIPLVSIVLDTDSGSSDIYKLYHKGTGITLMNAEENKQKIRELFCNNRVVCNDFKTHLAAFDMDLDCEYDSYDPCVERPKIGADIKLSVKFLIETVKELRSHKPEAWSSLVAKASIPYQYIEKKGYLYFDQEVHSTFYLNTFTGRVKSVDFSIHGKGDGDKIESVDLERNVFLHFDWMSADMRFGSILSNDDVMIDTFIESDPYDYIANAMNISREETKKTLLKASYNKDFDDWIFGAYGKYAAWMANNVKIVESGGSICNIVGRPFKIDENHDEKSVISAPLQGSVASAIHSVVNKIYKLDKNILFTDIYDSIVCSCSSGVAKDVMEEIGNIMYRPFEGILDDDITMPYRVSAGFGWRKWKLVKEVR